MEKTEISRTEIFVVVSAMLAMVAARLIMVATGFDPAYDQSMLLSNFPLDHPSEILQPLPYFEQATTLGHGLIMDLLSRHFGPHGMERIYAIRTVSALVFSASLFWLYFLLRTRFSSSEALLSVALIGCSPTALTFAVNSKHYSFEFAATVLLLGATLHYLNHPGFWRAVLVVIAGAIAALFAFVAPVIFATVGIATLIAQVVEARQRQVPTAHFRRGIAVTIAMGVALVLIASGFYFGYSNIVATFDRTAFAYRDAEKFIEINDLLSHQSLRNALNYSTYFYKLTEVGFQEYETKLRLSRMLMGASALLFFLIGAVSLWQRSPFWVSAALAVPVITIALNLAQIFPFSGVRQHLFAAPLIVPLIAVGIVRSARMIAGWLGTPRFASGVAYLLVAATITLSGVGALRSNNTISGLMGDMEASGAPVWAYYGAQPILRTLQSGWMEDEGPQVEGLLSHHSSNNRWVSQARLGDDTSILMDYYIESAKSISRQDSLWLVFAGWFFDVVETEGLEMFLHHARGSDRDCAIWRNRRPMLVAFCGPVDKVDSARDRIPGDLSAEWAVSIESGEWLEYVKGETGKALRDGGQTPRIATDFLLEH